MFGPDDAFLIPLMKMLRIFPVFPMFGHGHTALQPTYVEDVAEAIVRCCEAPELGMTYELGGPNTYTYKELLQTLCDYLEVRRVLAPIPINLWKMLAFAAEFLPAAPVTRNQVELMTRDNVASGRHPGFEALSIEPKGTEMVLAPARPEQV
jgi:NADH dehydrogenase